MAQLAVTCLGSGAAFGEGRLWSSILLDRRILLDLPPTALFQLHKVGADIAAIDYVFISHFHADHSFGIPFLLLLYHFTLHRDRPLYMIGPRGLEKRTEQLSALAWPELVRKGLAPDLILKYVEVGADGEYRAGGLEFTAVRMEHFGLDAYGYRLSVDGREVAYTGDTGDCPQLYSLVAGADVVITELTHPVPTDDPGHLDSRTVTRIARASAGVVMVTHIGGVPSPIPGAIICHDGETYLV